MALLDILHYPDERLHTVAKPVEVFDAKLKQLVEDMAETMYTANGIGLAATQVNVHQQLLVIDISEERNQLQVFVNAQITTTEGETSYEEGCLSVPNIYDSVTRAEKVTVEAYDINGEKFSLSADGLLAICIQHELDHLKGKLFIEHLSKLKQNRIKTKLLKQEKKLKI